VSVVGEGSDRLDSDVDDQDEVAESDELLRPTLGNIGVCPARAEPPEDDEPCERLDQAVCPEPDQRDRGGSDARADREALSYRDLWRSWAIANDPRIQRHVRYLEERYGVSLAAD
jgi:hypothetical protein